MKRVESDSDIGVVTSKGAVVLNDEQLRAIDLGMTARVSVITGGPGTGKTTIIRDLLGRAEGAGQTVLLCAPTGKAAKRMNEQTGREARTVHRTLEFSPVEGGFQRNEEYPLDADLVVCDEASMMDLPLTDAFLDAIDGERTRLVFVGDVDQLPSVGPGRVLADLIDSETVPVTRLERVYRQSEHSWISANARAIRVGKQITVCNQTSEDFYWFDCATPEEVTEKIVGIVCDRLPKAKGYDPLRDIQVLAPQYRGGCGVDEINRALQARLNPASERPSWKLGDRAIGVGDRVMQTENNYTLGVMNGEVGTVSGCGDVLVVDYGDREVVYDRTQAFNGLVLSFCATVHKAQGSQFPVILFACHSTHSYMLSRAIIYTAITRAESIAIILGDLKGLNRAISNAESNRRHSGLRDALRSWRAA